MRMVTAITSLISHATSLFKKVRSYLPSFPFFLSPPSALPIQTFNANPFFFFLFYVIFLCNNVTVNLCVILLSEFEVGNESKTESGYH